MVDERLLLTKVAFHFLDGTFIFSLSAFSFLAIRGPAAYKTAQWCRPVAHSVADSSFVRTAGQFHHVGWYVELEVLPSSLLFHPIDSHHEDAFVWSKIVDRRARHSFHNGCFLGKLKSRR